MENAANLADIETYQSKVSEMRTGASWFYWVAIAAVLSTFLVYFVNFQTHFIGLGVNEYLDARALASGSDTLRWGTILLQIAIAGILAAFGYFAWKGSDIAFILGLFLYFVDAVVLLGYREIFAFGFHLFAMFFIFKGLLASRRRFDPSVDATGA
jgi:hypothetical protein